MTVKLLVADDEYIIRDGIRKQIDWNGLGIELVGAVENGRIALELLKNDTIDILLTDIHMPFMDGIQLCREARKLHPNIKIVVLSGYEEFEFAKQALELSVMKYILKPFTRKELEEAVLQAKNEVTAHRMMETTLQVTMERLQESFPLLREKVLTRLVEGRLGQREARKKLEWLEVPLSGERSAVMIVEQDESYSPPLQDEEGETKSSDLMLLMLRDEIERFLRNRAQALVFNGLNANVICILDQIDDQRHEDLYDIAVQIKAHLLDVINVSVSIGLGGVKRDFAGIAQSYREALEALEYRFLIGESSVIPIDYINLADSSAMFFLPEKHADNLVTATRIGNKAGIRGELDAIFAALRECSGLGIPAIRLCMKEFLVHTLRLLLQSGLRLKALYGNDFDPYSELDGYKTMDDMHRGLRELFIDISEFIRDKRGNKKRTVIEKAIELILTRYHIEELSINQLSEELQMNTSYFSRLFKQETGNTFTEYLTQIRIEKAKEMLLGTTLRVSEITFRIGMKDPFYFSTLFKKYTGLNPTDFREQ